VRPSSASAYPEKQVEGDYTAASHPRLSVVTWNDLRGGLGIEKMEPGQTDRFWRSFVSTRHRRHVTLPYITTTTADPSVSGTITAIGEMTVDTATDNGTGIKTIFAAMNGGTDVYAYDNVNDDWGLSGAGPTKIHDLAGSAATDAINFVLSGVEYLAFACVTDWSYTSQTDYTSWTNNTTDTSFFTFWEGKLWGISANGQLWWAIDLATINLEANLQDDFAIQDGDVVGMFVGPDAIGEPVIYVSTKIGLFAHDRAGERFLKTAVTYPRSAKAKRGAAWNGEIYQPVDMAVYRYSPQNAVVAHSGIDQDDGMEDTEFGSISHMVASHTWLLASIDPEAGGSRIGSIIGYDGNGWHKAYTNAVSVNENFDSLHVSDAYGSSRMWFAKNARVLYQREDVSLKNPTSGEPPQYNAGSGTSLFLPWFDAGEPGTDKLAVAVKVEGRDLSSTEDISVSRYLNYGDTAVALGPPMTADGVTTYNLADAGIEFRAIQFQVVLDRGSTATITPGFISLTLEYRKKLSPKYGFEVDLDLTKTTGGRSPMEQFDDLITAIESNQKVEINYEIRTGKTRNAFVDIVGLNGLEDAGLHPAGMFTLQMVEP
jgi:hypothetical protein